LASGVALIVIVMRAVLHLEANDSNAYVPILYSAC